jgi:ribosomal protein L15
MRQVELLGRKAGSGDGDCLGRGDAGEGKGMTTCVEGGFLLWKR